MTDRYGIIALRDILGLFICSDRRVRFEIRLRFGSRLFHDKSLRNGDYYGKQ